MVQRKRSDLVSGAARGPAVATGETTGRAAPQGSILSFPREELIFLVATGQGDPGNIDVDGGILFSFSKVFEVDVGNR